MHEPRPRGPALALGLMLATALLARVAPRAEANPCPPVLPLAALNGADGSALPGSQAGARAGVALTGVGDVSGDLLADIVVGAPLGDPGGRAEAGLAHLVLGRAGGLGPSLGLGTLDGSNGFTMLGAAAGDWTGYSAAGMGDVNGDGRGDWVVGAPSATVAGKTAAGKVYVLFGRAGGYPATLDLATLDGSNGFVLLGAEQDDRAGESVALGDVNGDSLADVVVGAPNPRLGKVHVVFGHRPPFGASLDLASLDGVSGFTMTGSGRAGSGVAAGGDLNGDLRDEVLVGSSGSQAWLVYGRAAGFPATLDLSALSAPEGTRLAGAAGDILDDVAIASDITGDGLDEALLGSVSASPGGRGSAGVAYVLLGRPGGFGDRFDLTALDGRNGFRLEGEASGDLAGESVAGAGDLDGDGYGDLLVGAPAYPLKPAPGQAHVLFGGPGAYPASFSLGVLDGTLGFKLLGEATGDAAGYSVAPAGDVSGEGRPDLLVGAPGSNAAGADSGIAYLVYGGCEASAARHLLRDRSLTRIDPPQPPLGQLLPLDPVRHSFRTAFRSGGIDPGALLLPGAPLIFYGLEGPARALLSKTPGMEVRIQF